jgi:hypothetical protein
LAAREIAESLAAHALIRTHESEIVAVTSFDSQDQLESALDAVADMVKTS